MQLYENTLCIQCKYLKILGLNFTCKAFPGGIPMDIITNEFVHTKRHPQQKNDVTFQKTKHSFPKNPKNN